MVMHQQSRTYKPWHSNQTNTDYLSYSYYTRVRPIPWRSTPVTTINGEFPEVSVLPAYDIHVALFLVSLLQQGPSSHIVEGVRWCPLGSPNERILGPDHGTLSQGCRNLSLIIIITTTTTICHQHHYNHHLHYHHHNHHDHLPPSSLQPPPSLSSSQAPWPSVTIIITTTTTICHDHHQNHHHHLSQSSSQPPCPSVTIIITTTIDS